MKSPWYRAFLYLGTLPTDLVGWLVVLVVRALWGRDLTWFDGVLFVRLRKDTWFEKRFYTKWGGSTIAHAIMINERWDNESIVTHELAHVEQNEANGLVGLVCALAVVWWAWWLALIFWFLMPTIVYTLSGCAAVLRGEDWYRGNHNEESARAHALAQGRE